MVNEKNDIQILKITKEELMNEMEEDIKLNQDGQNDEKSGNILLK